MSTKNKPKGLGRGLGAILDIKDFDGDKNKPVFRGGVEEIRLASIKPNPTQPRQDFDEESLSELAGSIRTLGLIQPLTVRKESDESYTIISGERRYRASQMAGLETVPVYVRKVDDNTMLEMALVENIQRQDLNALEIAFTFQRLMEECSITQEALADRVGKKRSTVANYVRLLKLPAELQAALQNDIITMGHARALLAVDSRAKQLSLLRRVVKNALSVRQTEELVKSLSEENRKNVKPVVEEEFPESYTRLVEHLERFFNENISIKKRPSGEGTIVIGFKNDSDIEEMLSKFETIG
ncbi:MAG: ParB/RepB/Spo0J family partition protein [Rikenellaceae bacterium]|nr:ParB/RepB/Spo0J family partition protein [Rikenellaceae bacterium]